MYILYVQINGALKFPEIEVKKIKWKHSIL